MSNPYIEILEGESLVRPAPGARHELICARLHKLLTASVANFPGTRLLPGRAQVKLNQHSSLCPDIGLVTTATGKLWLAAEVVSADDHRPDTVIKKQIYEEVRLPRLWMVDPRYDNVEIYHAILKREACMRGNAANAAACAATSFFLGAEQVTAQVRVEQADGAPVL